MQDLTNAALAISGALFDSVWEGAVIFAVVWSALRLLRNLGASTRYAIWLCTLLALVIVPAGTIILSSHAAQQSATASAADISDATMDVAPAPGAVTYNGSAGVGALPASANARITVSQGVVMGVAMLWAFVAAARLALLLWNFQQLAQIRASARLWSERYAYPVWISDTVTVPIAVGFLRPAVLLPAALIDEQSADAVAAIVLHEIAHLRRFDVWTNALARVTDAVLALNPAAWLVLRQLAVEREIACDDAVVNQLGSGDTFARALATIATSNRRGVPMAAPSALGSQQSVITRIEHLLDAHPRRLRLSLSALGGALMFLAIIAILMQTISPVLAYSPQSAAPPSLHVAAACTVANRPVQMESVIYTSHGKKVDWESPVPASIGEKFRGTDKVAILDVTIDASGKVRNVSVVSSPDRRSAQFAVRRFETITYRPAVKNCHDVAATFRTWYPVRSRQQRLYSIVSASYPKGWSAQHPGACRVPNVIHGGVPAVGMQVNKPLSTSVRVIVDAIGAVTSAAIVNSSGNTEFDKATLAAARGNTYPLNDSTGFKPVRPNGANLSWNATHGYSAFSKCAPLPTQYVWKATLEPAGSPLSSGA